MCMSPDPTHVWFFSGGSQVEVYFTIYLRLFSYKVFLPKGVVVDCVSGVRVVTPDEKIHIIFIL